MTRAFLLALLPSVALAAPPKLTIPPEVRPAGQYVTLTPETDAVSVVYVGLSGVDAVPSALLKDGRVFLLDTRGLAVGRYGFAAVGAGKTGETVRADFTVIIGTPPTPPVPPGPGPKPPEPPTPTPAPIPEAGFRVLVVLESEDLSRLPFKQLAALRSDTVLRYLDAKCVREGTMPGWRVWDKDLPERMERATPGSWGRVNATWRNAMARPRAGVPWLIVSNGKTGWEGPLPADEAALMSKLQEFGE